MIISVKQAAIHLISMVVPQKESRILSDAAAFWEGNNTRAQDFSHWRGKGRWNDERWFGVGQTTFRMLKEALDRYSSWNDSDYQHLKVFELGPGGGANVVELCRHFGTVYGADISSPNLEECVRQVGSLSVTGDFIPIPFPIDKPESILEKAEKADIVLAMSVYTYFPSKKYGIHITDILADLLNSPGYAIIHIRHRDSVWKMVRGLNLRYVSMRRDYKRFVGFFAFGAKEFTRICRKSGLEVLEVKATQLGNSDYFLLKKK